MMSYATERVDEQAAKTPGGVVGSVRAFAVMSGGPTIGVLAALASVLLAGQALRHRRPPPPALRA